MNSPGSRTLELFFVTPNYGREQGGLGVSAQRLSEHLREIARVSVFVSSPEIPLGTSEIVEESATHRLIRISSVGREKEARQFFADVLEHFGREAADLALCGFYCGDLCRVVRVAAGFLGKPYFLFARGNDIDLEIFGEEESGILASLERARAVFCVTRELERKVLSLSPNARTRFIPNGADTAFFTPGPDGPARPRPRVAIFGDIKPKKGLEFLISSLDWDRFDLSIVGTLREEAGKFLHGYLSLYPERLENIRHIPYVTDPEKMRGHLREADIVCLPSFHEGMSNVMLEAMSCGKICVCSDVGGARDVLVSGTNGFLYESRSPEGLRRALESARAALADAASSVGRQARRAVCERYSTAAERRAYLNAFEDLLVKSADLPAALVPIGPAVQG
jgi:glycosyltransferase involved in cell wall biosynthesis